MKACIAELLGSFFIVLITVGAIHHGNHQQIDLLGISLGCGLAVAVMTAAMMAISGGHLNPVVTIGLVVGGKFPASRILPYIASQTAGALLAGWVCSFLFGAGVLGTATPDLGKGVVVGRGIALEGMLTFLWVFAFMATASDAPKTGFFVGLAVAVAVLFGLPLTGAGMNPVRVLATALFSGHWTNHIVYWLGPAVGAVLAGALYGRVLMAPVPKK